MTDASAIRDAVEQYVGAVVDGVDAIMVLYADDATVEDPVGSPVRTGLADIRAFYEAGPSAISSELHEVRVSGDSAAFLFSALVEVGAVRKEVSPIDVMTFDENAKILSMRAIWSADDVRPM